MGLVELKKELKNLEKDQLISLIADIYKNNKSVKEYLDYFIEPNEKELFEKCKAKVYESFYPKRGINYNFKNAKQAISEFKKHNPSPDLIAELILFYVETGIEFTNDFGDINERFYTSLENSYEEALNLMFKLNILDLFKERAVSVVRNTNDIGWGFHDFLYNTFIDYYPDYDVSYDSRKKRHSFKQ